jgi:hypothetical protein
MKRRKNALTSPTMPYEKKGIDPVTVNNFSCFVFLSNNNSPVKVEQGDRRYFMFDTNSEKIGDKAYFDAFSEYCENECNLKALYEYLLSVDISGVNWITDRPRTEAYEQLQAIFVDVVYQFLINFVQKYDEEEYYGSASVLYDIFQTWCSNNNKGKSDGMGGLHAPLTLPQFGISLKRLCVDKMSGISKKVSNGVKYTINKETLKAFFKKRNLFDLDFQFVEKNFMKVCRIRDEYD